jgi:hypothetical protein
MQLTRLQIAVLRAKCVARQSIKRAAEILIAAGIDLADAAHYVLSVLRAQRVAA